jgi:hypothetical protein
LTHIAGGELSRQVCKVSSIYKSRQGRDQKRKRDETHGWNWVVGIAVFIETKTDPDQISTGG